MTYTRTKQFTKNTLAKGSDVTFELDAVASAISALSATENSYLYYSYSSTTTMADPGAGILRLNNATLSSVTAMAIDDLCALTGNPDVSGYITTWGDYGSTIKGHLRIVKIGTQATFALFNITALTDNSGWSQVTLTHLASNGSFADSDSVGVIYAAAGADGDLSSSIADAKGDILVATADNTIARLAVGANGQALVADSGEASGVKWGDGYSPWTSALFGGF